MTTGELIYQHIRRKMRKNTIYLLPAGPLRKPFHIGQTITVVFGTVQKAEIAATLNNHIVVYVPGLGKTMTKGYPRKDVEIWNPEAA